MDTSQKGQLYKRHKEHKRRVSIAYRMLSLAEFYYFTHQTDHAGYHKRIGKCRLIISKARHSFTADARRIVSSRMRISWDGDLCCVIRHNPISILSIHKNPHNTDSGADLLVLGKPESDSLAAAMKHQQNKDKLAAPLKVKLREIEQRIIATAADYQQCMLDYQRLTQEIQALRDSMTRHRNAAGGLAALNPDDLAIVGQTRELAKQAHILSIYIPRKRVKLDNLHARRDALNNKRAVL